MSYNTKLDRTDSNSAFTNSALKELRVPGGNYKYPDGRDWRPGSPLHEHMLEVLKDNIQDSYKEMQPRHEVMREMDSLMTAYIRLDSHEKAIKEADPRKPVAMQVPLTYGIHQTLHTNYLSLLSANEGIDRFSPKGPEDAIGAILSEHVLKKQSEHFRELLAHSTQCSDFLKYGFGFQTPVWEIEEDFVELEGLRVPRINFEGNNVKNLDPYLVYPDPNCEITNVREMEYFGYDSRSNLHRTLKREASSPEWFNAKYLSILLEKDSAITNRRIQEIDQGHENAASNRRETNPENAYSANTVHETVVHKWIIPNMIEYTTKNGGTSRLGDSAYPELWMFVMAGDRIILMAQPSPFLHNRIPVVGAAPESNGYGCNPISHLEMSRGIQDTVNFKINAQNAFTRRFFKGRWMGDPNAFDLESLLLGKDFIAMDRLHTRGKSPDQVLQSIQVADPFSGQNIAETAQLQELMYMATGATQPLQGVLQARGERRSATEAQGARMGALNRIEKMLLIASMQSMQDLSYLKLRQTQEFMSEDMYIRIVGRYEDQLMAEYGKRRAAFETGDESLSGFAIDAQGMFPVSPLDLDVAVDVSPIDVTRRAEEHFDSHLTLFQTLLSNPWALQNMDMARYWKHMARLGGFKNVDDFIIQGGDIQMDTVSDEQAEKDVKAGNAIPAPLPNQQGGAIL